MLNIQQLLDKASALALSQSYLMISITDEGTHYLI